MVFNKGLSYLRSPIKGRLQSQGTVGNPESCGKSMGLGRGGGCCSSSSCPPSAPPSGLGIGKLPPPALQSPTGTTFRTRKFPWRREETIWTIVVFKVNTSSLLCTWMASTCRPNKWEDPWLSLRGQISLKGVWRKSPNILFGAGISLRWDIGKNELVAGWSLNF